MWCNMINKYVIKEKKKMKVLSDANNVVVSIVADT